MLAIDMALPRLALELARPTVLVLGDSISNGAGASTWERSYLAAWTGRLEEGLGWRPRIVNQSWGGRTSRDGRDLVERACLDAVPDLVVVAYGTNDQKPVRRRRGLVRRPVDVTPEEYEANVREIVYHAQRRSSADVILVSPGLVPPVTAYCEVYRDLLAAVAADTGATLVDVTAAWPRDIGYAETVAADGVHPSDAGHAIYAAELARAVLS